MRVGVESGIEIGEFCQKFRSSRIDIEGRRMWSDESGKRWNWSWNFGVGAITALLCAIVILGS